MAKEASAGEICRLGGASSPLDFYFDIRNAVRTYYSPSQAAVVLYGGSAYALQTGAKLDETDLDVIVVVNPEVTGAVAIRHHIAHAVIPRAVLGIKEKMDMCQGVRSVVEESYAEFYHDDKKKKDIRAKVYENEGWIDSHHIIVVPQESEASGNDSKYKRVYIRRHADILLPRQPGLMRWRRHPVRRSPVYMSINHSIANFSLTRLRWRSKRKPCASSSILDVSTSNMGGDIERVVCESGWWRQSACRGDFGGNEAPNEVIAASAAMLKRELLKMINDDTIAEDRIEELVARVEKLDQMIDDDGAGTMLVQLHV